MVVGWSPTTGPTCSAGCSTDWSPRPTRPDTVIVVDNASGDHTQQVLARATTSRCTVIRSDENVGGAGGFRIGMETAYDGGWDRIWLMDDDVVPAPDCLEVLMARRPRARRLPDVRARGPRRPARREVAPRASTCATRWRSGPRRPASRRRTPTRAAMPPLVEIQVVAFEGFLVRRRVVDAVGLPDPDVLHLLRRRRLRPARPPGGVPDLGGARRRPGAAAGVLAAARARHLEGLLHVPQPLRGALPPRGERAGAGQALRHHRRRRGAEPAARRTRRGAQCDPRHSRRSGHAARRGVGRAESGRAASPR